MKDYEMRSSFYLPRRTYAIIRLDGKAFHTFTKGFKRPFDEDLINMMDNTAKHLCEQIQGVKLAYVQSDEITLVLTDFDDVKTQAWFGNNIQKMCSISAALATAEFNYLYDSYLSSNALFSTKSSKKSLPVFDSRVFCIPEQEEVKNCLIWRQEDATKNSITSVALSYYSAKEIHGKNSNEKQEMIFQKGLNWNNLPVGQKRGRLIIKQQKPGQAVNKKTGETISFTRNSWESVETPIFTSQEGQELLDKVIPKQGV